MSTCNWLDLQTLGSQPVMPKNLPDHWSGHSAIEVIKEINNKYQNWTTTQILILAGCRKMREPL